MSAELQAQLSAVEASIAAERKDLEQHRRDWRLACGEGMYGHAFELEVAITASDRALLRYSVRREALEQKIKTETQPEQDPA